MKKEIFVFGSNLAGRHGKGAAKYAIQHYGAIYGVGYGLQGSSFGIPTKDTKLKTLPLTHIQHYVNLFLKFAKEHSELSFRLTSIGCGLAGYKHSDIAPMFRSVPSNVVMPKEFLAILGKE